MRALLIATDNNGKLKEYRVLLEGMPLNIVSPSEICLHLDVAETGSTFEENARLKAEAYAAASGLLTLADDSGLEVDALGGRPGVYSARYGGQQLTDEERVSLLLSELHGVPWPRRTARFRCVIALSCPFGNTQTVEGACEGFVAMSPQGTNGFGYDPIFCLPHLGKTMAQLPPVLKNVLSHRGVAAAAAKPILMAMLRPAQGEV